MKVAYYPGCSLDATAVEYGISTKRAAARLNIDLVEIPDWNCCGASSAHATDHLLSLALPARNLAIAEKQGLNVLAPCAACYNRMRTVEYEVKRSPEAREMVQKAIQMEYRAETQTISVLELLAEKYGLEELANKVVNPLKGMRPACYYGCLLVRPQEVTGFDDPEDPQSMDKIMAALGASPVTWSHKSECCGAGLTVTKPDVGLKLVYNILSEAKRAGADSIVTACPICMLNLDMRQQAVEKKYNVKFDLPIYYVTELVAIACGDEPEEAGVSRHFVEAVSFFATLPEKAKAMEEEAKKKEVRPKAKAVEETKEEGEEEAKDEADIDVNALAAKFYSDQEKIALLTAVLQRDRQRMIKLAKMLEEDREKAIKAADSLVAKEKKNKGEEG